MKGSTPFWPTSILSLYLLSDNDNIIKNNLSIIEKEQDPVTILMYDSREINNI
jgi:hypothetical protein